MPFSLLMGKMRLRELRNVPWSYWASQRLSCRLPGCPMLLFPSQVFFSWCLVAKSCPTLCDPMGCSPLGSSVHGIPQASILEWVASSFSRGSSQPRDGTHISCIARPILYCWATREAHLYLPPLESSALRASFCPSERQTLESHTRFTARLPGVMFSRGYPGSGTAVYSLWVLKTQNT